MYVGDVAVQLLIEKWAKTGLLSKAKPENYETIADRLEDAARRCLATKRPEPIEEEIKALRAEGLLGT